MLNLKKKKKKQKTWRPRCCPPERISPLSFLGPHHFPVLGEARCGQVAQQLRPRSFSCSKIAQSPLLSQPSFATRQDPGNILTTSQILKESSVESLLTWCKALQETVLRLQGCFHFSHGDLLSELPISGWHRQKKSQGFRQQGRSFWKGNFPVSPMPLSSLSLLINSHCQFLEKLSR